EPDSGEVLSSFDVSHHVSSPSADVVTSNAVVVNNTQLSRDASIDQLSDDGDIETSSDDEAVESQSINEPQPNVFSITDPNDKQLE
ncbi:hypothetical protein HAX54_032799, partial [Datura stramonium]|nr:hypothetical protein [Datura stramonium]